MEPTIHRGLAGVYFAESDICHIDGERGELYYRGYDIRDLTEATYVEVVYLLWHGELPTAKQLADFRAELVPHYPIPDKVMELLLCLPEGTDPMHMLQAAAAMLAAFDENPDEIDPDNLRRIGLSLVVQFPYIVATFERIRRGQEPLEPRADLGLAGNFLYMLNGELPERAAVRVLNTALLLHAEHGSNASTFTARTSASTLTDAYSAIAAAVGSLKGPLHGGANEAVMRTLEGIGSIEGVEQFVLDTLAKPKGRVMGFGHRVYRVLDPRGKILRDVAEKLAKTSEEAKYFHMSLEMERVMEREMAARGKHDVKPNLDFFSASVYRMLGIAVDMYTPVFAIARVSGWMAHLFEQYADNHLVRPRLHYRGELGRRFVPIAQRG
jgi:citrate synthase